MCAELAAGCPPPLPLAWARTKAPSPPPSAQLAPTAATKAPPPAPGPAEVNPWSTHAGSSRFMPRKPAAVVMTARLTDATVRLRLVRMMRLRLTSMRMAVTSCVDRTRCMSCAT